ncbi:MAG: hypothetical protein CBC79_00015 [Gammaproteobacteria bacterium TMED119]|nr:MAG: hypothetical protein CBC79_00015 [Gammaproteobacteria bacterium TMED119]|tara:strand:+ start:303 stop:671 length:369 start_codon:yes stop_codon:yes gene_type:complete
MQQLNVFGEPLVECSCDPMTGYFRDGSCNTEANDVGSHTLCAQMTQAFLDFSVAEGNDLVTPQPQYGFPGLKAGDRWCLCALRWQHAQQANVAPKVVMQATNQAVLDVVPLALLKQHALDMA